MAHVYASNQTGSNHRSRYSYPGRWSFVACKLRTSQAIHNFDRKGTRKLIDAGILLPEETWWLHFFALPLLTANSLTWHKSSIFDENWLFLQFWTVFFGPSIFKAIYCRLRQSSFQTNYDSMVPSKNRCRAVYRGLFWTTNHKYDDTSQPILLQYQIAKIDGKNSKTRVFITKLWWSCSRFNRWCLVFMGKPRVTP